MYTQSIRARLLRFVVAAAIFAVIPCFAQTGQAEFVRNNLSGRRMLVTYREGGSLYGTYYSLDVQFCRSGRYITAAESRKTTIMDHEQVNRWQDIGTWDVVLYLGQPVLRYVSMSNGSTNAVRARVLPGGRLWFGEGISVQRIGPAFCQ